LAPRRYKSRAISAAGHGQRPPDAAPSSEPAPSPAQQGAPEQKPAPNTEPISSLKAQIEQQRYYQQQQANPVFRYLASIPGLSARQVHYLTAYFTSYPDKLNAEHWGTIANAHHQALAHGIEPDSDQYFHFVNGQLHQQPPSPPPMPPAPPPMPEPRPEHVTVDIEKHEAPEDEPEEDHAMASFISAPPSRGDHAHSIEPQLSPSSVRLSAEQRDMAHRSMPHLSADEAEKSYAANLLKMQKMQKSGLIK